MSNIKLLVAFVSFFSISFLVTPVFSQSGDSGGGSGGGMSDAVKKGKELYQNKCASCHKPQQKLIGPQLYGAKENWVELDDYKGKSGEEWFYEWVKNSQGVIDEGLPYAKNLYEEYNQQVMTAMPQLTNEKIDQIFAYVQYKVEEADQQAAAAKAAKKSDEGEDQGTSKTTVIIFGVLAGFLLVISLLLYRVTRVLNRLVKEKKGEYVPPATPVWKNRKVHVTGTLLLVVFIGYVTVDNAVSLGRQQGYQPEQPIKFSHKLHAGKNNIDCQYCHSDASKSKHSNIPSLGTCMNCHKAIKEGPKYGKKEIKKVTEAYEAGESVDWVRIHNLPDHVYFNHSQHVQVANLDCQNCHGPVQEMEKVYQHSTLSMGWCVNCHRESEVNFSGNEYYKETYKTFHKKIKEGDISTVTVKDIGGTDCQKCHY